MYIGCKQFTFKLIFFYDINIFLNVDCKETELMEWEIEYQTKTTSIFQNFYFQTRNFTVYSLQSTVYSLQSTVYSLQSTVYSL